MDRTSGQTQVKLSLLRSFSLKILPQLGQNPAYEYIGQARPKSGHVETLVKSYISLVLTYLHMHSGHWQPIPFLFVLTYAQWA